MPPIASLIQDIVKPVNSGELFITLARWIDMNADDDRPESHIFADCDTGRESRENTTLPNTLPGIDLQKGGARLEGNTALYIRLLKDFTDHYCESSGDATELLKQDKYEEVRRLGEKLFVHS